MPNDFKVYKNSSLCVLKMSQRQSWPISFKSIFSSSSSSSSEEEGEGDVSSRGVVGGEVGEDCDHLQPTMWLGTEDGCIHVYNSSDNIRIKKNKVKIQHGSSVHCIM